MLPRQTLRSKPRPYSQAVRFDSLTAVYLHALHVDSSPSLPRPSFLEKCIVPPPHSFSSF